MRLSDQAVGTLMMALQKCLLEQIDIVEILKDFEFIIQGESQSELIIANPPTVSFDDEFMEELEEAKTN
tara:strand:- start:1566 stop:1772 length:207 start_codon:yes stop_codon:yes gene_type:complete